jgi:L-lactate dehydrogenase complex protein LldG
MNQGHRKRILSRLELALGFPARDEELLKAGHGDGSIPWVEPGQPWDTLQREMETLATRFHRAATPREARAIVGEVLREHQVRRAVRWHHPGLEALDLDALLAEAGVEVAPPLPPGEQWTRWAGQAELGITAAEALLVESGTLVVRSCPGQPRAVSLLPPVHLAVVVPGQRLASVHDLPPLLRHWMDTGGGLPSAVHLISGPSRTGDIEMTLVMGAHGPKFVHVLALEPGS